MAPTEVLPKRQGTKSKESGNTDDIRDPSRMPSGTPKALDQTHKKSQPIRPLDQKIPHKEAPKSPRKRGTSSKDRTLQQKGPGKANCMTKDQLWQGSR
ncbi:uncharacterized protein G2W53_032901 [Senna tora]|uniref:Uncharacterized protein n=1 Tax=Senna tora TaxID=362788 RepID=A0A834W6P1_9FABA|nr:uncharacterized protein G2W53_032901 [Senna tora]